jgi:TolB-like protein/DNA-binding winged helix-turn-helix (wHTH) protein/cytochrome c-type biogenesis protein CcmH/NrfG
MDADAAVPPPDLGYLVDDLRVDVARAVVTRAGEVVALPRLSFDLLLALIEAAPRIVSLDELMTKVWGTVVVSPETVSQRVKLLRDALGDNPREPRYVAGVRGRGYRLVAGVTVARAAEPTGAPITVSLAVATGAEATRLTVTQRYRPRRAWATAAVLMFALASVIAWFATQPAVDRADGAGGDDRALALPASPRSVAVLPFTSLGSGERGDVLAFGIAEALLHRLANLRELEVVARTSSFSLTTKSRDVRAIGRELNARYLLEGSVQHDGTRLRVTAQLIDSETGMHLWSVQLDRTQADVFAVQDEIATQVAKVLALSLDGSAANRLEERSTANFDAYLAYLQGRALLASGRVVEARAAIESFRNALRLDPGFAAAYVSLAEADVFVAEFAAVPDRTTRFLAAGRRAALLVGKALQLEPRYAPAYFMRGYLEAFSDLRTAEASYRRGLELRPSDARAYAGLAAILFEQPAKRNEALAMLDRARRLDPLEPMHDVNKAVFLLYGRGDDAGADALLRQVLRRQPLYLPAITRLGEIAWCCQGSPSEAIRYLEQAIALDPLAHWPRRPLVSAYLDAGDPLAAADVVADTARSAEVLRVPLLAYDGNWRQAGEVAYQALAQDMVTPIDESIVVLSIRRHALLTGDYPRAVAALEKLSGVRWAADKRPIVPDRPNLRISTVGLADMLQRGGDPQRAQALLQAVIAKMKGELANGDRSELWYYGSMSIALALAGDTDQALDWLERGVTAGYLRRGSGDWVDLEPAFDRLHGNTRFATLIEQVRTHARDEHSKLLQLRAAGIVPDRG